MALSDADFAWRYPCGGAAVGIECDGRTCYAYLGIDAPPFGGTAWLFNLVEGPEGFVPPADGRAPLNPGPVSRAFDLDDAVRPEAFSVAAFEEGGREEIEIRYDGTLVGAVWFGGRGGYSRFARAVSPVASPLPWRRLDEGDLHELALAQTDPVRSLRVWRELAARGNPDAPERLRVFAQSLDPAHRDPARETLSALGLSHDDPMP